MEKVNVLTFKWGFVYSAEYVNRIYRGVKRHLHRPFRFVCMTDDPKGLCDGVEAVPFPEMPPTMKLDEKYDSWPNIYVKLCAFRDGFAGLEGTTLFLDVDQIVTGDLDCFFDYRPGEFCIIRNWVTLRKRLFKKVPFCGNSSVFRFEAGKMGYVYEKFLSEIETAMNQYVYPTEQLYMTHAVGFDRVNFWPENFVRSFKRTCTWPWPLNHLLVPRLPKDTRILCFHGYPTPQQAIEGYRHAKHLEGWTRPAPWVKELWEK